MAKAKYSELPFDEIDKLYAQGGSPYSIARDLNLSSGLVMKYIYGPEFRLPRRTKSESTRLGHQRNNSERFMKTGRMLYKVIPCEE